MSHLMSLWKKVSDPADTVSVQRLYIMTICFTHLNYCIYLVPHSLSPSVTTQTNVFNQAIFVWQHCQKIV